MEGLTSDDSAGRPSSAASAGAPPAGASAASTVAGSGSASCRSSPWPVFSPLDGAEAPGCWSASPAAGGSSALSEATESAKESEASTGWLARTPCSAALSSEESACVAQGRISVKIKLRLRHRVIEWVHARSRQPAGKMPGCYSQPGDVAELSR